MMTDTRLGSYLVTAGTYEDTTVLATIVGTREQAQAWADRWNLDHIAEIAQQSGAGYAEITGEAEVVIASDIGPRPGLLPQLAAAEPTAAVQQPDYRLHAGQYRYACPTQGDGLYRLVGPLGEPMGEALTLDEARRWAAVDAWDRHTRRS